MQIPDTIPVTIPTTYNGILEFINENRALIAKDFKLILRIFNILDSLLKHANNMSDLHKDTKIVLETIKLQLDSFLKEFKNEISLSKMLAMAETDELDDFFTFIKSRSLSITFADRLDFNYTVKESVEKIRTVYDKQFGKIEIPEALEGVDNNVEATHAIQNIKNRVISERQVEYFDLIFDSESFSKTVRNAFSLALALRMKQVSLVMKDSILVAVPYEFSEMENNHSVFEMTPIQYENLKKNLTKNLE